MKIRRNIGRKNKVNEVKNEEKGYCLLLVKFKLLIVKIGNATSLKVRLRALATLLK